MTSSRRSLAGAALAVCLALFLFNPSLLFSQAAPAPLLAPSEYLGNGEIWTVDAEAPR